MRPSFKFKSFKTRVARRVFLLFIACAVLPISVLGLVSFLQVKKNLEGQYYNKLRLDSRSVMLSIYERFQLLQNEMITLAATGGGSSLEEPVRQRVTKHFISWHWEDGAGAVPRASDAFSLDIRHRGGGLPQLSIRYNEKRGGRQLVGMIDPKFLWEASERIPRENDVVVLQDDNSLIFANKIGHVADILQIVGKTGWKGRNETMTWQGEKGRFSAGYSILFLPALFGDCPTWKVLVIAPYSEVVEPMAEFKIAFPAMIIFSLAVVMMLGQYLIRRSTDPIELLQKGTRHIADGDFGYEVDIKSSDEFQELGNSFNDMSRRIKEGQTLLLRAARMGTMGQMASGIIHEVKQPLSAVYGLVQLVLMDTTDERNAASLQTVLKAVEDLDTSLNRFRSFSQDAPVEMSIVDLNQIIEEVFRLLAIRFRKRSIECQLKLAPELPKINADRRGLQQVLSNLMINALDALEETAPPSPLVTITTGVVEDQVVLTVSDNAGGIPEEIRDKIFDPFFTTKAADKGTGLGMAIVDAIIHQHGADIALDSVTGKGTTFRIVFSQEEERSAA